MLSPITIDNQPYLVPTWQEMGQITLKLAQMIKQSNQQFDRLVALAKGGWGWARQLQDFLEIRHLSGVQISFYEHIGKTKKSPVIIQSLPISVAGEHILIYDDVVDSGETMALAKDYLNIHGAKSVHTTSHYTKSWTKFNPDYSAASTEAWIIFPHDVVEMVKLLEEKWANVSNEERANRYQKLGIDQAIVSLALNK